MLPHCGVSTVVAPGVNSYTPVAPSIGRARGGVVGGVVACQRALRAVAFQSMTASAWLSWRALRSTVTAGRGVMVMGVAERRWRGSRGSMGWAIAGIGGV